MQGRRKIEHSCLICGERFYNFTYNSKYCPDCHRKYDKEIDSEKHKRAYAIKINAPPPTAMALRAEIREIEEYNKRHGTCLTYGQYKHLKKEGKLDELESIG